MNYLFTISIIGLLILIHELGHLIAAKITGIGISIFSIGFGPKLWKFKKNETEYRISLIPIGGYVLPEVENEKEFFKIPLYKRIIFSMGGPIANIIIAIFLLGIINFTKTGFSIQGVFIEPFIISAKFFIHFITSLSSLFTNPDSLSGIVGIVSQGTQFINSNLIKAIQFTAIISLNLAVFNLLPFPVLDGGKIFLYSLEKIHPKFIKLHVPLSIAGWIVILGLMIFVTVMDIGRLT